MAKKLTLTPAQRGRYKLRATVSKMDVAVTMESCAMSLAIGTAPGEAKAPSLKLRTTPRGCLPARMRILYVSGRQRSGEWLAESIATDSAAEVLLEKSVGMAAGLA